MKLRRIGQIALALCMAAGLAVTQGCHDDPPAGAAPAPGPAPVALGGGMITLNPTLTFNGTGNSGSLTYDNNPDPGSLYTSSFEGSWEYIRVSPQTGILKITGVGANTGADVGKRLSGPVNGLECNLLFIPVDATNQDIASITVTIIQPGAPAIVETAMVVGNSLSGVAPPEGSMAPGSGNAPDSLDAFLLDVDYCLPLSALDAEEQAFVLQQIPGTTGFDCESGFFLQAGDSPSSGTVFIETNGDCSALPSNTPIMEELGLIEDSGSHSYTYTRLTENTASVSLTLELETGFFGVFVAEVEFDDMGNVTILSQSDPQGIGVQLKAIQAEFDPL